MSFISSLGAWLRKVSKSFMGATISGKTITLTRHNGDTVTLTTQDTTYSDATQSEPGLMSVNDKKKLDGITAGAEPNQNAFASVLVGNTNVAADVKSDTLTLVAGSNITLTPDATNDKITIAAKDTVTTVSTTGNGNAITSITASDGALTVKKDSTFSLSNHTHSYLPLSGGTLTGALTFANGTWNTVGDDVKIGDVNKAGTLGVMGTNGATTIAFFKQNDTSNYKTISYDGTTLQVDGNSTTASKLSTPRTITLGNQFQGSATFDGSSNITINGLPYCATIGIGNTNNFPYHYIGTTGVLASTYQECLLTLLVTVGHNYDCCGICHIKVRTAVSGTNSSCAVRWIVRDSNMPVDLIQVGFRNVFGSTIADLFYKSSGNYQSGKVQVLESGYSTGWNRCFTLNPSSEANSTTPSNKGSSFYSYASLTEAQNTLHSSQPYTHTVIATDVGIVSSANSATKALNADNGTEIGMKIGTTYTLYTTQCAGYVTANKKSLVFTIPVQRLFPDISWNASNPTLSLTLIRIYPPGGSGYVDGLANGTVSKGYCIGGIRVGVSYSTALGSAITNNACVTVVIQGTIKFN